MLITVIPETGSTTIVSAAAYRRQQIADNKASELEMHLRQCGHSGLNNVRVQLDDGLINLEGFVSSYYLKQLAQETIRPLAIGMRIRNQLRVQ